MTHQHGFKLKDYQSSLKTWERGEVYINHHGLPESTKMSIKANTQTSFLHGTTGKCHIQPVMQIREAFNILKKQQKKHSIQPVTANC